MLKYKEKKILYWSFLIAYVIGMLVLATTASFDFIPLDWRRTTDNIGHFCLLGSFAWLVLLGLNLKNGGVINWKGDSYWAAFLYAFFFGIVIESIQSFFEARKTSLHDAGINTLGIVFVLLTTYFYSRRKK